MSELILVRHGQASFGAQNYDQLSPLGEAQAAALGRYWAARGQIFAAVYVGPLQRHGQTLTAVAHSYQQNGRQLPAPTLLPGLAEHQAMEIFQQALPQLSQRSDRLGELARLADNGRLPPRIHLRAFEHFCQLWSRAELASAPYEPWVDFRARVRQALEKMVAQSDSGQTIAVFTSGGVIAAAAGYALEIAHDKTMALNGALYNASLSQFRFSTQEERFTLSQFNGTPHLDEKLLTYI